MIATQKATRGFIVEVLNYNTFQTLENYKSDTKSDTKSEMKATQKRNESDTINKNDNNDKNDKKKREYAPSVFLSEEEYQKLITEIGDYLTKEYIKDLSLYLQSKGKRYKSHYATVLAWYRRDEKQGKVKRPQDDESQPKYIPKTKLTPEQIEKNKVKITEALEKLKNKFDIPIKAKGG